MNRIARLWIFFAVPWRVLGSAERSDADLYQDKHTPRCQKYKFNFFGKFTTYFVPMLKISFSSIETQALNLSEAMLIVFTLLDYLHCGYDRHIRGVGNKRTHRYTVATIIVYSHEQLFDKE